jgi:repressor LexA
VLSWRQQKILQAIENFAQRRGYAPSLHEIGEAAGLASRSSVSYQLDILQRKGYLRRIAGHPRTIELRVPGRPAIRLDD